MTSQDKLEVQNVIEVTLYELWNLPIRNKRLRLIFVSKLIDSKDFFDCLQDGFRQDFI